jgi:hypothetical protein
LRAATQLAVRKEAEADITAADQLIAVYAPQGVEALRSSRGVKSKERASLDVELDKSSTLPDLADPATEGCMLDGAKLSQTTARAALNEAQESHQQHSNNLAVARANLENAKRNLAEATQQLDATRHEIRDAQLATTLSAATGTCADAERAKGETARGQTGGGRERTPPGPDKPRNRRSRTTQIARSRNRPRKSVDRG